MKVIFSFILFISLIWNLYANTFSCSKGLGVCCSKLDSNFCKCTRKKNNCPFYFPACTDKKQKRVVKRDEISISILCK